MAERRVATARRWLSGLLAGAVLIAVASGLVALIEPHVPDLVGLPSMFLLAVLPVAIRWGAGPGLAVAAASVTAFDFLFVPPRLSLAVADARYGISLGVFLITTAAIAQLAASSRRGLRESTRLSREQAGLRRVAMLVAHATQPREVFAAVSDEIARLLEPDLTMLVRFEPDGSATFLAGGGWHGRGMQVGRTVPVPSSLAPLRDGAVVRFDDLRERPDMSETVERQGILGVVGCPIVVEGRVWGAFGVGSRSGGFPAATEQRLVDFTELIGTAIANTESRSEISRLLDEQAALHRVATLVARGVSPEEVFTTVADEIGRVLGADAALMLRLDGDGVTTVMGEMGYGPDEMPIGSRWELDPQLAMAQALLTGRSARRNDYRGVTGTLAGIVRRMEIRSVVAIPITVQGRTWGALGVGTTRERFPADTEERMAGFTELVGTAIANAEGRAEITRLLDVQASLRRVAMLVAREVPPEEITSTVAEEIGRFVDADALLMTRLDPDGVCTVVAQHGPHPPALHVGQRWALDPNLAMSEAMRTGRPAYRDRYANLGEPSAGYIESMGIRCSVAIPISVDGWIWGALGVSRIRAEVFPADTAERMGSFTELLATAVRNSRARAEIVRLLDEQAALRQVATVVAHGAPAREVFASVADEVIRLLDVDVASLFRIHGEMATSVAVSGWEGGPVGATVRTNPRLMEHLEVRGAFRLDDIAEAPEADEAMRGSGARAIVGYAITVEGGLWGGFVVGSRDGPLPAGTERRLANYAELIATAIANTENRAQIFRLLDEQAALRRVATLVATGPSPAEVSRAVAEEVRGLLDLDDAGVCRYEPDGSAVLLAGLGDNLSQWPPGTRWELDQVASSSEVLRTGSSARFDAERWAHAPGSVAAQLRKRGVRSVAATPVVVDGRLWGAVMAWSSRSSLPEDTEQRMGHFTELVAMAIGNSENRSQILRLLDEQAALRRVATLVATGPSPTEVSRVVADEVRKLLGVEDAGVCRYEPDGTGVLVVGLGPSISKSAPRWALDESAASSEVWRTGRSARFDADHWAQASSPIAAQLRRLEVRSVAASPVVVDGRLWGAVVVWSKQEPLPPDTEDRMARFTELVAMAIGNAESRAELAASRARIVAASDETRRRIERDLHDGAQQRLVSLGLELRLTQASVPDELPEVRAGIGGVADELSNVLDELREMARGIHPAMLSEGGLRPALRTLARRAPIPVELELATDARFSEPVEVAAYYVVSEALTNAAKHADASYVRVSLTEQGGVMHLSVRDDGVGGADPQRGSGLIGLRDRVEALGGTVEIKSAQGSGTMVLVTLPVSDSRGR